MTLTVIGIAIGLAGAYVLTKYLESLTSMLFGVEARDPWTFAVIAVLLAAVALIACLVPARRATKVDPLTALQIRVKPQIGTDRTQMMDAIFKDIRYGIRSF